MEYYIFLLLQTQRKSFLTMADCNGLILVVTARVSSDTEEACRLLKKMMTLQNLPAPNFRALRRNVDPYVFLLNSCSFHWRFLRQFRTRTVETVGSRNRAIYTRFQWTLKI